MTSVEETSLALRHPLAPGIALGSEITPVGGERVLVGTEGEVMTIDIGTRVLHGNAVRPRMLDAPQQDYRSKVPSRSKILQLNDAFLINAFHLISVVAPTIANVLLHGKTPDDSESVAHTIHRLSERRSAPFVKVDCAAISPECFEQELFGTNHRGSSGLTKQRPGCFERAFQGTLYLSEIAACPRPLQRRLLRVLQDREFVRPASNRIYNIDVRLVASTSQDLGEMVRQSRFDEELYYQLKIFPIDLPISSQDRNVSLADLLKPLTHDFKNKI